MKTMTERLPFRQIHLDFHTHADIDGIGADFRPQEFADTLVKASVNSINLFARCHHGYLYYRSKRFPQFQHPRLTRDLLREQIAACHARGIRAPIYVSMQWDALQAELHPEWLVRAPDGKVFTPAFAPGFYNWLCLNSPYEAYLRELVTDILETLPVDGFWFDILLPYDCACGHCRTRMLAQGLDPAEEAVRRHFAADTLWRFKREMSAFVRTRKPEALLFYNSGHVGPALQRELDAFTHLELESLPSGQWGYDHFPSTIRYARTLGKETLGMTGKFHTQWGDFHSFKNPEALAFECFSMLAHGAKCCVGDQLHPRGRLCPHTYDLIGSVYREVERREPWCAGAVPVVDIGVLTPEEFAVETKFEALPGIIKGAMRVLQELRHQLDVIDSQADFGRYRLLILPDEIPVDAALAAKIEAFLAAGGALIASHRSGLNGEGTAFALPLGGRYTGPAPFTPMFVTPREALASGLPLTEHVMYETGTAVEPLAGSEVLADNIAPYFNRTWRHYCSHQHAPSSGNLCGPAIVQAGRVVYFAQPLFTQYQKNAPRWCRALLKGALDRLLPQPALRVQAPSTLIATVTRQAAETRQLVHLLHYLPIRTNAGLDIVDEVVPLHDVEVSVRVDGPVAAVRCVPEGTPLPFTQADGRARFTVPVLNGYQIVEVAEPCPK
jgi:hypothetical protein